MSDTKMTALLGGEQLTVTYNDGTSESVKVRQLPVRLLQAYLALLDDESGMVELFCDKPKNWSDGLTIASFEAIVNKGEELNAESFFGWLQRRVARQEKLVPNSTGEAGKEILSRSQTSLLKPPSAAA